MTNPTGDALRAASTGPRAPYMHVLKTWPEEFEAIIRGDKRFEYRFDDRGFSVGDFLRLREFCPARGHSKRSVIMKVTHIVRDAFGVPPGYAVLSVAPEEAMGNNRPSPTGPRALLASLTDEEAEAVVALVRRGVGTHRFEAGPARSAIAKLRGEGA